MVEKADFITAARIYVMEALDCLAEIIRDVKAPAATRLRAITLLLDRAIGRQGSNAEPRTGLIPVTPFKRDQVTAPAAPASPATQPIGRVVLPGIPRGR